MSGISRDVQEEGVQAVSEFVGSSGKCVSKVVKYCVIRRADFDSYVSPRYDPGVKQPTGFSNTDFFFFFLNIQ